MDTSKPLEKRVGHSLLIVRLIALSKFLKATLLLVVGYLLLHMLHLGGNFHDALHDFVNNLRLDPNNQYIHTLLEKTIGIRTTTLRLFGVGTLVYSGLFYIEAVGLFFDRGWAEWMTVITTAGFIPVEIYEITRETTVARITILVLNVLIAIYIGMRIRWRYAAKKVARAEGVSVKVIEQRVKERARGGQAIPAER